MRKRAGMDTGTEAWDELRAMLRSRVDTDAQFRNLFVSATEAMKRGDQSLMRKLLVQAPAAITQAPNLTRDLTKVSSVQAFFEENGNFMTDAQRRFPELLKVSAAPMPVPKLNPMKPTTKQTGPVPVQSALSNGSA